MNALPFLKKVVAALLHLGHESPEVRTLYADAGHDLGIIVRPQQVDFRLPCSGVVNMRLFVIGGVDDEPEAVGAVNDNYTSK
jgi:hypothetical protein